MTQTATFLPVEDARALLARRGQADLLSPARRTQVEVIRPADLLTGRRSLTCQRCTSQIALSLPCVADVLSGPDGVLGPRLPEGVPYLTPVERQCVAVLLAADGQPVPPYMLLRAVYGGSYGVESVRMARVHIARLRLKLEASGSPWRIPRLTRRTPAHADSWGYQLLREETA